MAKKEKLSESYRKYIESVKALEQWTCFKVEKEGKIGDMRGHVLKIYKTVV